MVKVCVLLPPPPPPPPPPPQAARKAIRKTIATEDASRRRGESDFLIALDARKSARQSTMKVAAEIPAACCSNDGPSGRTEGRRGAMASAGASIVSITVVPPCTGVTGLTLNWKLMPAGAGGQESWRGFAVLPFVLTTIW